MKRWILPLAVVILLGLVVVSLGVGKYQISGGDILRLCWGHLAGNCSLPREQQHLLGNILFDIRLPRIIAALLMGASLAVSGTAFQALFVNPLVSPGLLGVLAGSSFGAALGMVCSEKWLVVQGMSLCFGFIAVLLALAIAHIFARPSVLMLVLGGIISGAFFTAALSIVKYLADPTDELPAIIYWLMGSLSAVDSPTIKVVILPIVGSLVLLLAHGNRLNVLSMGEDEAKSLGISVAAVRVRVICLATLVSALTVVLGGIIGWVGLIIPHICRMLVGPDNRLLLPLSAMIGAMYLLVVDDATRLLFTYEIPTGIVTALLGIPFFVLVLKNAQRGWQ